MKILLPFCACLLLAACGEEEARVNYEDLVNNPHWVIPCPHAAILYTSQAERAEADKWIANTCKHQELRCASDGRCEIAAVW